MLTQDERAAINRQNAEKSTGPKTEEGKAKSARNSRTHGLTVSDLTLSIENAEEIEAAASAWTEALEPEGIEQEEMVKQVAIGMHKRDRMNLAESAILDEQVLNALNEWDRANSLRFEHAKIAFRKNPAFALLDLRDNGLGLLWLIIQWENLKQAFEKFGCWNNLELIKEALRLSGYDPIRLHQEPMRAYDFAAQAVYCVSDENLPLDMMSFLSTSMPPQFIGCYGKTGYYPTEEARAYVRSWIEDEITSLKARETVVDEQEANSRGGAETRALALKDSPDNRLLFRYMRANESSLDKTLKRLEKMKLDARKAAENEAKKASEAAQQNEAIPRATSPERTIHVGSYIDFRNQRYEVMDSSERGIYMVPVPLGTPDELMDQEMPFPDVVSKPNPGV